MFDEVVLACRSAARQFNINDWNGTLGHLNKALSLLDRLKIKGPHGNTISNYKKRIVANINSVMFKRVLDQRENALNISRWNPDYEFNETMLKGTEVKLYWQEVLDYNLACFHYYTGALSKAMEILEVLCDQELPSENVVNLAFEISIQQGNQSKAKQCMRRSGIFTSDLHRAMVKFKFQTCFGGEFIKIETIFNEMNKENDLELVLAAHLLLADTINDLTEKCKHLGNARALILDQTGIRKIFYFAFYYSSLATLNISLGYQTAATIFLEWKEYYVNICKETGLLLVMK
jgi:hypothetical protein